MSSLVDFVVFCCHSVHILNESKPLHDVDDSAKRPGERRESGRNDSGGERDPGQNDPVPFIYIIYRLFSIISLDKTSRYCALTLVVFNFMKY
jgi:hypothetical protein